VVALLLASSACRVTITTDVDVDADGSGVVHVGVGLDRDALAQVPDLAEQLRVDDLRRAGWRVLGPRREADGLTWVRARHAFATPAEASRVLAQLNGPAGPFRGFAVTRDGSVFRKRVRFSGTVDLTRGLEGLADAELERRLGAANPGVDAATLKQRFGVELADALEVQVSAHLPGSVSTWSPRTGDPPLALEASSTTWNVRAVALGAAAAVALLVGVGLAVRRRRTAAVPPPE
jgi:hypothetical protein